jgi:N-acetylglucosamine-6-phosphate deacetylase
MSSDIITFANARLCVGGELLHEPLTVSREDGTIVGFDEGPDGEVVDVHGGIIAPGFIELQTNGMRGFHFTHFDDEDSYARKVDDVAQYLPSTGVTSFYATIPTVSSDEFKKVVPHCISYTSQG